MTITLCKALAWIVYISKYAVEIRILVKIREATRKY